MITKTISNKIVNFATNLDELSLQNIVDYHKIFNDQNIDEVDKIIKILTMLSDSDESVIEDMEISDATSLFKKIMIDNNLEIKLQNKDFILNGKTFKVKDKISIKDISSIKKVIELKSDSLEYIYDVAAILYKEVKEDGSLKIDYSPEHIQEKVELFKSKMTYDYIVFHLNNLNTVLKAQSNVLG
jgi:hypothetical protein